MSESGIIKTRADLWNMVSPTLIKEGRGAEDAIQVFERLVAASKRTEEESRLRQEMKAERDGWYAAHEAVWKDKLLLAKRAEAAERLHDEHCAARLQSVAELRRAAHEACQCGCHEGGADVGSWCGVCGDLHPAIDALARAGGRLRRDNS